MAQNDRLRRLYPWADEESLATLAARSDPAGLLPYQRALLDVISGPESGGRYNVIYGGRKFSDYSRHPGVAVPIQSGPNVGKTSSAAGRYQFIGPTWESYRKKLNLPDFSPASQDRAAWALAKDVYGPNLDQVLLSGDPQAIAGVGQKLAGTWTSLPGGIEQGTNVNKFVSAFNQSLGSPQAVNMATQGAAASAANNTALNAATNAAMQAASGMYGAAANQSVANQLMATQQAAGASPFASLLSMISASQPKQQTVTTKKDAIEPGIGGQGDVDPVQAAIATSHTPNVYMNKRREERFPYSFRI